MSQQQKCSVIYGIKQEIIDLIPKYCGTDTPTLREWATGIAEAVFRIPKGADDPGLKPYLMYVTVNDQAKEVLGQCLHARPRARTYS